MSPFKFNKPIVESPYPPQSIDVLWAEVDENSGLLVSLSEFIGGRWVVTYVINETSLLRSYVYPNGETEDPQTIPYYGSGDSNFVVGSLDEGSEAAAELATLTETYNTVIGHITAQTEVLDEQVGSLTTIIEGLDPTGDAELIAALTTVKTNVNSASTVLKGDIPDKPEPLI